MSFDTHELAWMAGFFDGEGHTGMRAPRSRRAPILSVSQAGDTTPEVLLRIRRAVGFGSVYGPYGPYVREKNEQPVWYFRVAGYEKVQAVVALMWLWLGTTKRQQAAAVLREAAYHGRVYRCTRGHAVEDGACQKCAAQGKKLREGRAAWRRIEKAHMVAVGVA